MAIALMLAILAIDPSQLASLSATVQSKHWQILSLVALTLALLLWFGLWMLKHPASSLLKSSLFSQKTSQKKAQQRHFVTPLVQLQQTGVVRLLLSALIVLLFWLAVVGNALAQRLQAIALSPTHDIYVDAQVTPIGLSDRRLEMATASANPTSHQSTSDKPASNQSSSDKPTSNQSSSDKPASDKPSHTKKSPSTTQVVQGYRQLVRLTHIQPATRLSLNEGLHEGVAANGDSNSTNSNNKNQNQNQNKVAQRLDNPFATSAAASAQSNHNSNHNNNHSNNQGEGQPAPENTAEDLTVMLQTYQRNAAWLNELAPNQHVSMRLKLSPLDINNTPHEFNEYRWLSTRHAVASAQLIEAYQAQVQPLDALTLAQKINRYRYELRLHFLKLAQQAPAATASQTAATKIAPALEITTATATTATATTATETTAADAPQRADAAAVTLSLLTGDRSLISNDMTGLYRFAGISHLLAISGAHVLFLAVLSASLAALLANRFCPYLYRLLPRWQLKFWVAVLAAFAYAFFAGFDVPAVRTAWMLLIVGVARYLLVSTSVYKIVLLLAVAMACQDVFILWQAGFWLSFVAVVMLIAYSQYWEDARSDSDALAVLKQPEKAFAPVTPLARVKPLLWGFLQLQLWMSIALLPISIWLFGKVSLWGFVVNLFAIGLFGWVIVPLNLLAGLLYTLTPEALGLADALWRLIIGILAGLHQLLWSLQAAVSQVGWLHSDISVATLLLLLLLIVPWLLPRGLLSRYLSLPAVFLLCLLPWVPAATGNTKANPSTQLIVLDSGDAKFVAVLLRSAAVSQQALSPEPQHWLLLSSYFNASGNGADAAKLADALYDGLKQHSVKALTGVIGQTATPDIAKVVAQLRQDMPISIYGQAGYASANLTPLHQHIKTALQGTGLTAQSCAVGDSWQPPVAQTRSLLGLVAPSSTAANSAVPNKAGPSSASFGLTALTGWPALPDPALYDCALQLQSPYPTTLTQKNAEQQLQTIEIAKAGEAVLIYSSAQPKLAQLWQLMCLRPSAADPSAAANNDPNLGLTAQQQHWLLTPQAHIERSLVDSMAPTSWHSLQVRHAPPSASLLQTQLYWQQHYGSEPRPKTLAISP